jgi:predicted GTPase
VALAAAAVAEGKAVVIVLNKADLIGAGQWHTVREQLQAEMKAWLPQVSVREVPSPTLPLCRRLSRSRSAELWRWVAVGGVWWQVGSVPCVALSAADGEGVHELMPAAAALYDKWTQRVSTARLNRWLGRVALRNPTGALARIRYITQVRAH